MIFAGLIVIAIFLFIVAVALFALGATLAHLAREVTVWACNIHAELIRLTAELSGIKTGAWRAAAALEKIAQDQPQPLVRTDGRLKIEGPVEDQ